MLKKDRQIWIQEQVNKRGSISVNYLVEKLGVSDMTIRRDLAELSRNGLLEKVHGGAKRITDNDSTYEKSHIEKMGINIEEKIKIANKATEFIDDGETIFIGPGTTLEEFAKNLISRNLRVITNSLPVFDILNKSSSVDLLLTGGEYREVTGAFVGTMAISSIEDLRFAKGFVSSNAISDNSITTYSEAEGIIQKLALDNSVEKYLLADHSKFGEIDFYNFYTIDDLDYIVTTKYPEKNILKLENESKIILANL